MDREHAIFQELESFAVRMIRKICFRSLGVTKTVRLQWRYTNWHELNWVIQQHGKFTFNFTKSEEEILFKWFCIQRSEGGREYCIVHVLRATLFQSCLRLSHLWLYPPGSFVHGIFRCWITWVCHALLPEIFTQGLESWYLMFHSLSNVSLLTSAIWEALELLLYSA